MRLDDLYDLIPNKLYLNVQAALLDFLKPDIIHGLKKAIDDKCDFSDFCDSHERPPNPDSDELYEHAYERVLDKLSFDKDCAADAMPANRRWAARLDMVNEICDAPGDIFLPLADELYDFMMDELDKLK